MFHFGTQRTQVDVERLALVLHHAPTQAFFHHARLIVDFFNHEMLVSTLLDFAAFHRKSHNVAWHFDIVNREEVLQPNEPQDTRSQNSTVQMGSFHRKRTTSSPALSVTN